MLMEHQIYDVLTAATEIERLRDVARRVVEIPYFKNARIEALVRDAKEALELSRWPQVTTDATSEN